MTQDERPALTAEGVDFSYGDLKVLDGLSLEVPAGETFGILGANGSGKTTLMRLTVGVLRPSAGTVRVFGLRPSHSLADRIGYMPQLQALYLELSIQQNVEFFARMQGMTRKAERRDAVGTALEHVELWDRRGDAVNKLSGGQRQRVSLAIALVHRPGLLLLDEPTVGLDPELRASLWDHFRKLAAEGTTLVVSSHVMDDAAHCDRLGFIHSGRIIADGTPSELRAAAGQADSTLEDAFLHFVRRARD